MRKFLVNDLLLASAVIVLSLVIVFLFYKGYRKVVNYEQESLYEKYLDNLSYKIRRNPKRKEAKGLRDEIQQGYHLSGEYGAKTYAENYTQGLFEEELKHSRKGK